MVDRPVPFYVVEYFGLEVGEQKRLLAAKNLGKWSTEEPVLHVARAAKEFGGPIVSNFKFCYDEADKTVYCLAHQDDIAPGRHRYHFTIVDQGVTFYYVKSLVVRKNSVRAFLDVDIQTEVCFVVFI